MDRPLGLWPAPPAGDAAERLAVVLDGTLASAVAAATAVRMGRPAVGLIAAPPGAAEHAAMAMAAALELPCLALPEPRFAWSEPAGWGALVQAASGAEARRLVLPATRDEAEPPLPWRLAALDQAAQAFGLAGIWAPLIGYSPAEVARLGVAVGVSAEHATNP